MYLKVPEAEETVAEPVQMGAFSPHAGSHSLHCLHIAELALANP
jgi:hypothetical protein